MTTLSPLTHPSLVAERDTPRGARAVAWARRMADRPGVLAVFDQAVVSAANFFTSVVVGRCCAESELGVYFLALSLVYFARGIQEQVVSGPFTVYSQRREGEALARYTGSLFAHQLVLSAISLAALGILTAAVRAGFGPKSFLAVAPMLFLAAPLMLLRDLIRQLCFSTLNVRCALVIDGIASVVQVSLLGALALSGRLTVGTTYAAMGAACAAAAIAWRIGAPHRVRVRCLDIWTDFKTNWSFGRWALASQLVGCSMPYVLPWIVATTDGAEAAGLLGASGTLVGLGNMFVTGICNYLSPRAARAWIQGGSLELTRVLKRTSLLFAGILGPCCLAATMAGGQLLAFVFGSAFAGGGTILVLLSFNMLANSLGMTAGNGLWAVEKPAANFKADVVALVMTVASTAALAPGHGAEGTAAAMLIGTTCGAMVRAMTLRKVLRHASGS